LDLICIKCFDATCIKPISKDCSKKIKNQLIGIRDDFFPWSEQVLDAQIFLWNPKWKIRPSIAFISKKPYFLTCRNHEGGDSGRYLHPPCNPFGSLPSVLGDQLAHAVVRPHTIKAMQAHTYSHSYQMHDMRGCFTGVDTIMLAEHGNFNKPSYVLHNHESLCIQGQKDIRILLSKLINEQPLFARSIGENMCLDAAREIPLINKYDDCLEGATYISFRDALKLQSMTRNQPGATVKVLNQDEPNWQNASLCTFLALLFGACSSLQ
jgi:hypothetical protein